MLSENWMNLWAIAKVELGHSISQKKYWILLLVIYALSIFLLVMNSAAHANFSSLSASIGAIAPWGILQTMHEFSIVVFITIAAFLASEIRARDVRERMIQIIDTRPHSNLILVFGRFLGIVLSILIPIAVLLIVLQIVGWLPSLMGVPIGGTIDPRSLLGFIFYMALPVTVFISALVMFLSIVIRNRFVALLITAGLIFFLLSVAEIKPFALSLSMDLTGANQLEPSSKWVPAIADSAWWLQRLGVFLLGMALLVLCAVLYPRLDSSNKLKQTSLALGTLVVAFLSIGASYYSNVSDAKQQQNWLSAHKAASSQPVPDLLSVTGEVEIEPGDHLIANLELTFGAVSDDRLEYAIFTLNPGFEVSKITSASGQRLEAEHQDGLLRIKLAKTLTAGETSTVNLEYQGKPDIHFGYLDSAINIYDRTKHTGSHFLHEEGLSKGIFDDRYVALMPGIHWLPTSGTGLETQATAKDFFTFDLSVSVPQGWLPAGPAARQQVNAANDKVTYKFSPQKELHEVALLTAPFTSFSTEIDGVIFEVLLRQDHAETIGELSFASQELEQWIKQRLALINESGLSYPFDSFTLVDTPITLRSFGGGWRMDTTLAPPAMALLKESGFPSARFDITEDEAVLTDFIGLKYQSDPESDPAKAARNKLIRYFSNDFSGSNIFSAFARSIFYHQSTATGKEAVALEFAMNDLANMVIAGEPTYYSIENSLTTSGALVDILNSDKNPHQSTTEKLIDIYTSNPNVWELALDSSLSHLDYSAKPDLAVDVLTLKSGQLAKWMYDTHGPKKSGQLLARVLQETAHKPYNIEQVSTILDGLTEEEGKDSLAVMQSWFNDKDLAGFTTEKVEVYKLETESSSDDQYQLKMKLNNKESQLGFLRVAWKTESDVERQYSKPIKLEANSSLEFGIVLNQVPEKVYVIPYLSLNRKEFQVKLPNTKDIETKSLPALDGVQVAAVDEQQQDRIIVDDLDDGFSISEVERKGGFLWLRQVQNPKSRILDNGLPVARETPRYWSRKVEASAWGEYRHTVAYVQSGSDEAKVSMTTRLPNQGRWQLEIHLPDMDLDPKPEYGTWHLTITNGSQKHDITFNAKNSITGWNAVSAFELHSGDITVEFSGKSDGDVIIADAISWSRAP